MGRDGGYRPEEDNVRGKRGRGGGGRGRGQRGTRGK